MNEQLAVQNLLRTKLADIQRTNPQYSLRAYSKKLGVHVGALSSIMNGKRNISLDLAKRITERLMLDPQERSEVLTHFPEKRKYSKVADESFEPRYLELGAAQFKMVAEWEHFAVMSLINCADFQNESSWIAGRLNISENRAVQVVSRLLELGILELDSSASLKRSQKSFRTSDDIAHVSIQKAHHETLELAKESLHEVPVENRDFTSVTMAIDPKNLSVAKERIRKFQDELSDLLEAGTRAEVYRLSMQLFPLTKLKGKLI